MTWPGELQRGRYTLGCYRHMGLVDLVADSAADDVAKALALGTDRAHREAQRRRIREASPVLLDDSDRWSRGLTARYPSGLLEY